MTTKFKSHAGSMSNNYYLYARADSLFSPSGAVSVTEVTGSTPIFYPGASVLDGSLEAAGFVSVLWRQRQVDKSQ